MRCDANGHPTQRRGEKIDGRSLISSQPPCLVRCARCPRPPAGRLARSSLLSSSSSANAPRAFALIRSERPPRPFAGHGRSVDADRDTVASAAQNVTINTLDSSPRRDRARSAEGSRGSHMVETSTVPKSRLSSTTTAPVDHVTHLVPAMASPAAWRAGTMQSSRVVCGWRPRIRLTGASNASPCWVAAVRRCTCVRSAPLLATRLK